MHTAASPSPAHTPPLLSDLFRHLSLQGPDSFLGTKVVTGASAFAKELRVSEEDGANAEEGKFSCFCGENNYNFLQGYLDGFLHSAIICPIFGTQMHKILSRSATL